MTTFAVGLSGLTLHTRSTCAGISRRSHGSKSCAGSISAGWAVEGEGATAMGLDVSGSSALGASVGFWSTDSAPTKVKASILSNSKVGRRNWLHVGLAADATGQHA